MPEGIGRVPLAKAYVGQKRWAQPHDRFEALPAPLISTAVFMACGPPKVLENAFCPEPLSMGTSPSPLSSRAKPRDLQFRGPFLEMFFDRSQRTEEICGSLLQRPTLGPFRQHFQSPSTPEEKDVTWLRPYSLPGVSRKRFRV